MIRFDTARLRRDHDRFLASHKTMIGTVLHESIEVVNSEIYQHPGFKPVTHQVQDSTKTKVVRTRRGQLLRITNSNKRARWLEEGTQPHWIFPHKKKVLRFRGKNGFWVSKKVVKHPGTKPYWFLRSARNAAFVSAHSRIESGMRSVSKNFGR